MRLRRWVSVGAAAALVLAAMPGSAQVGTIDPNSAIDSDLDPPAPPRQQEAPPQPDQPYNDPYAAPAPGQEAPPPSSDPMSARRQATNTFQRDDLIGAAEGVFGKGASGLARIIENILRDQGEPNAYIAGREAAGAIVVGLRYGSGKMFHKVEGERPVYWTGPSVGFDLGGDATKVFVLVYNLYDTQDLYKRYPSGEGRVYLVGGFSATYLRRGNVVLIPIRLGVGWRLGVNAGYMKFTEKKRWLPF
ncbi:EipA family protein [Sphingomonas canadensis]|uniref:EipA family protein n=1 Tax=Sphingomonas canadensis TaxID=1219257 RepID=A0ABW3H8F5_9SPHN|nr:EipA family protein [Sphingomonas canadensis]MCW3834496.1 EipA family protein [Sphingomonas canadensis]